MASHSHDHGAAAHSQSHSSESPAGHSHGGVECAGHAAPSEANLASQRLEKLAFDKVVASFYAYESHSLSANHRRLKDLLTLPKPQQDLLVKLGYREKLRKVDDCIHANAEFVRAIVDEVGTGMFSDPDEVEEEQSVSEPVEGEEEEYDFGSDDEYDTSSPMPPSSHGHSHGDGGACGGGAGHSHSDPSPVPTPSPAETNSSVSKAKKTKPSEMDMDKIRSTLKQVVREWSAEGKPERDASYKPILDALSTIYKDIPDEDRLKIKVLSPGVGLARLAYEIAHLGFASQGSEFSFHMLLPSFFILNLTPEPNSHTIYPFVHSFSNHLTSDSMLRPVTIPDVSPTDLPKGSDFSLVAGDFLDVYGKGDEDGQWDVITTCFFIDTAKNIMQYLETIKRCLAPGGTWINIGPLLWHWENNSTNEPSIELSLDEVKILCSEMGFELKDEKILPTGYTANAEGMLRYQYQTAFWTATLKE